MEDAETLTIREQSDFIKKLLYFRDHLKGLLVSEEFISFNRGQISYSVVYKRIEEAFKADLDISLVFNSLLPPRDLSNLQNYLNRAEWQAFKSKTKQDEFKQLVLYAQYDRRYLRSVLFFQQTSSAFHRKNSKGAF